MTHSQDSTPANPAQVTDAMVELACKTHAPQWDGMDDTIKQYARIQMRAAIEAIFPRITDDMVERAYDAFTRSFASSPIGTNNTRNDLRAALTAAIGAGGQAVASPVSDDYFIQERDDDMLICAKHWQHGSICIARRPKLATNDEWRSTAQDIVNALSALTHPAPSGQAVAVKPLEWYDPGNRIEYADTLLGSYKVASGSWWLDNGEMEHCGSREAAKAAAILTYGGRDEQH